MTLPPPLAELVRTAGLDATTPGFAAALRRGDAAPTFWCVGVRDAEGRPVTPDTNFRIASVTKQFTAAAILQLVERGALTLDTTLDQLLPEYPRPIPVRHLLTHRSGVPDYERHLPAGDGQVTDGQVVEILAGVDEPMVPPDTAYHYSNSAYCLLARVVVRVTGRSFAEYLTSHVFPVAAVGTTDGVPERAYGFTRTADGWRLTDQNRTSATQGDGGVYTSVTGLLDWQRALYEDHAVLSPESVALMTTPYTDTEYDGERYGFGIALTRIRGRRCHEHHGESVGFDNALFYLPDERVSLAILSNIGGAGGRQIDIGRRLLEAL